MIVGNDISHYQGQIDWPTFKNNSNFVIAKATDGENSIDSMYGYNRQKARELGMPFGSYHFTEAGDVNKEVARFCSVIDGDPIREGEILVLDYELALPNPVPYCKEWLDKVSAHFGGMKPFIYLNRSLTTSFDWSPVVNAGYPLWQADYTGNPNINSGQFGKWGKAVMQQWTSSQKVPGISGNVDGNAFFGDVASFKAYGYRKPAPVPPPTPEPPAPPPQPPTPPVPTPVPTPVPVPTPCPEAAKLKAIHDVLYGSGWWWTKWAKIKELLPQ